MIKENEMRSILQLDIAGFPQEWITPHEAATLICSDNVAWTTGSPVTELYGGHSRLTGVRSHLIIPSIIATKGVAKINLSDIEPPLTRHNYKLFARDRHMCAYCGEVFPEKKLTREHIHPVSKGGENTWMNTVTACQDCNWSKADLTLEQAGMTLLYLPYIPNRYEDFLLQKGNRKIIADQMEFLLHKVPKNSRLLS